MKSAYEYAILRYIHDPVVGEFANFGVVVFSKDRHQLLSKISPRVSRIGRFFGEISSEQFRFLAEFIQERVEYLGERHFDALGLERNPETLGEFLGKLVPKDDSSIQFSDISMGLSENLERTLEEIFDRYVILSTERGRSRKDEQEIWSAFRKKLDHEVIYLLDKKKIESENAEYEFQHAWKNQRWHLIEPVSFDLADAQYVQRKAFNWLGVAEGVLKGKSEECRLEMVVGVPTEKRLFKAFDRALKTLDQMSCDHELILDSESEKFAIRLSREVAQHKKGK